MTAAPVEPFCSCGHPWNEHADTGEASPCLAVACACVEFDGLARDAAHAAELRAEPVPPAQAPETRGRINDRWRLRMTPDRVAFHRDRPGWQVEQTAAMHDRIGAMDVVYYCGAECGDFPALLATWGARLVLIEPQPLSWPSIRAHFVGNRVEPLACLVGFAGDEDRNLEATVYGPGDWPPEALVPGPIQPDPGFRHLAADPETPAVKIDTLAQALPAPQVICIDTEGSELRVLRGARATLRERRPVVFLSVHLDQDWIDSQYPGDGWPAIEAFLTSVGYGWEVLAESHERHVLCTPA